MKQAIFLLIDNGVDGRAKDRIVFASISENERDAFCDESPNKNLLTKRDQVIDLQQVALEVWNTLNGLQKYALLQTTAPMWQADFQTNTGNLGTH